MAVFSFLSSPRGKELHKTLSISLPFLLVPSLILCAETGGRQGGKICVLSFVCVSWETLCVSIQSICCEAEWHKTNLAKVWRENRGRIPWKRMNHFSSRYQTKQGCVLTRPMSGIITIFTTRMSLTTEICYLFTISSFKERGLTQSQQHCFIFTIHSLKICKWVSWCLLLKSRTCKVSFLQWWSKYTDQVLE